MHNEKHRIFVFHYTGISCSFLVREASITARSSRPLLRTCRKRNPALRMRAPLPNHLTSHLAEEPMFSTSARSLDSLKSHGRLRTMSRLWPVSMVLEASILPPICPVLSDS